MATSIKISSLSTVTTPLGGTEQIPMNQSGTTKIGTPTNITASLSTVVSTGLSTSVAADTSLSTALSTTNSTAVVLSTSTSTGLSTAVSTGASLSTAVAGKQATLVSATNIKTINSSSLLGAGDLVVSAAPGGSTTEIQYNDAGSLAGDSALTWDKTNNVLAIAQGTLTTSQPQTLSVTWNDGAVTFKGLTYSFTDTASASGSLLSDWLVGGTSVHSIGKAGVGKFMSGRAQISITNDGNDPVLTNNGSGAVHLYVARNLTDYILLSGSQRRAEFYSDSNQVISVGFTAAKIFSSWYSEEFLIQGHTRNVDEARQNIRIKGGDQQASASTNLDGGDLILEGGAGASGSAGDADGGHVYLRGGTAYGTGTTGFIIMDNLPTSSAGLPTGAIWSNSGVLTIV